MGCGGVTLKNGRMKSKPYCVNCAHCRHCGTLISKSNRQGKNQLPSVERMRRVEYTQTVHERHIRKKKTLNKTNATNELLNHSGRWTAKIIFRTAANEQAKQFNENKSSTCGGITWKKEKRNLTGKCGANFQWDPLPSAKTFPFLFELFLRFVYARWAEWPVCLMYAQTYTTQTSTILFRAVRNSWVHLTSLSSKQVVGGPPPQRKS